MGQWPVYSIREDVPDLVITFKDENIRQKQQTLTVITIRVSNPGSAPITLTSFDSRDLPGFVVTGGKLIKLDTVEVSKKLEKTLQLTRFNENAYVIDPLIMDRDQFFVVKLLVLSPESTHPQVSSCGNVAGIDKTEIITSSSADENRSLLARTFYGRWPIQVFRGLGYTITTLLITVLIGTMIGKGSEAVKKRHRRALVRKFRGLLDHEPTKKEGAVFDCYIKSGESAVVQLNASFSDRSLLSKSVLEYTESLDPNKPRTPSQSDVYLLSMLPEDLLPWNRRFIPMLIDQKIIIVKDGSVEIDQQTVTTVGSFESFLLANEPQKIKTAKQPFGSDLHPVADIESLPGTKKAE